jgi:hypothetical protein
VPSNEGRAGMKEARKRKGSQWKKWRGLLA